MQGWQQSKNALPEPQGQEVTVSFLLMDYLD